MPSAAGARESARAVCRWQVPLGAATAPARPRAEGGHSRVSRARRERRSLYLFPTPTTLHSHPPTQNHTHHHLPQCCLGARARRSSGGQSGGCVCGGEWRPARETAARRVCGGTAGHHRSAPLEKRHQKQESNPSPRQLKPLIRQAAERRSFWKRSDAGNLNSRISRRWARACRLMAPRSPVRVAREVAPRRGVRKGARARLAGGGAD